MRGIGMMEPPIATHRLCGPGTKPQKRLKRGDQPLDRSCLKHALFYSREKSTELLQKANKILADATQRFHSTDAPLGEKLYALGVAGALKAKIKLGLGMKSRKRHQW